MDWYEPTLDRESDGRPRTAIAAATLWLFGFGIMCVALGVVVVVQNGVLQPDATLFAGVHSLVTLWTLVAVVGIWKRSYRGLSTAAGLSLVWGIAGGVVVARSLWLVTNGGTRIQGIFWGNVLLVTTPLVQFLVAGACGWYAARILNHKQSQPFGIEIATRFHLMLWFAAAVWFATIPSVVHLVIKFTDRPGIGLGFELWTMLISECVASFVVCLGAIAILSGQDQLTQRIATVAIWVGGVVLGAAFLIAVLIGLLSNQFHHLNWDNILVLFVPVVQLFAGGCCVKYATRSIDRRGSWHSHE
jgi:hypothetical protein